MNQRGEYGSRSYGARVGGRLFHTVGDRDALLEATNTGWQRLVRGLVARMGIDPTDLVPDAAAMARDPVGYTRRAKAALAKLQQSPLHPFWRDVVTPEYDAFNKFYAGQSSWEEWKTDYSTYENWATRLKLMRAAVNERLTSPTGPTGSTGSPNRGEYGSRVGGILFHTVGDRDALVEQTNTGWQQLVRELITRMGVNPVDLIPDPAAMARDVPGYTRRVKAALVKLEQSPLFPFWRDVVTPEYDAFNKFYAKQSSWEEFKTDYSTYENWAARLEKMRATVNKRLAEEKVAPLAGPSFVPLPKTVMEKGGEAVEEAGKLAKRGAEGAGGAAVDLVKIAKYGVIGVLVVGGAVALTSVASHLRKGTDPVEKYASLARRNAREAAGTALAIRGK
jgi:hypothetical protein